MKKYQLHTQNMNDSLVFYRALFNRMPDELDGWKMKYSLPGLQVEIAESPDHIQESTIRSLEIRSKAQVGKIYQRMGRFMAVAKMREDCKKLDDAFGLLDPDGNKWIIGNPQSEVHFERCYIHSNFK